jgi:NAD-dependent dihydropyrimidine dehydrogenase PreA subunit
MVMDDARPDLNYAYGQAFMKTPNMDRLAKSGMVFRHAYAQFAVCSPSRNSFMTGRRPDTTKVYNFLTNFREVGPNWISFPEHFKLAGYTTLGSGKIYHTNCAPKGWTCDECTVVSSENQPPNQDEPYSWSQDKPYKTPCQEYCPPDVFNASHPSAPCPATALGDWLSPSDPKDVFTFENDPRGTAVVLNTSKCSDCAFSLAEGHLTSTGIELTLSFDTKPERDRMVGTLHSRGCELTWATNSTGASGRWGSWYRRRAGQPASAFSAATRGYAACGDPAPFTSFNDYNSTVDAIANLEYAVSKGGKPFFIAMGVFKPHYPWHVPKQFADLYEQDDIALPSAAAQRAPANMVPWAFDLGLDGLTRFQILNSSAQGGSCEVPVNGPNSTMPRWAFQAMRKGYYSALSWSDHLVGMMLSKMDELNVTASTVTIL